MAKAFSFVPNYAGYRDLLNGEGVQGVVEGIAESIKETATASLSEDWGDPPKNDHFALGTFVTKTGADGRYVRASSEHAKRSQSKRKTLTKAFNKARKG